MSDLRNAAQQALNALDSLHSAYRRAVGLVDRSHDDSATIAAHNAGAALRAALAEPEQSPEALGYVPLSDDGRSVFIDGLGMVPLAHSALTPRKPVELTDEQIVQVLGSVRESITGNVFLAFARAVIAAYERKNGITGEGA